MNQTPESGPTLRVTLADQPKVAPTTDQILDPQIPLLYTLVPGDSHRTFQALETVVRAISSGQMEIPSAFGELSRRLAFWRGEDRDSVGAYMQRVYARMDAFNASAAFFLSWAQSIEIGLIREFAIKGGMLTRSETAGKYTLAENTENWGICIELLESFNSRRFNGRVFYTEPVKNVYKDTNGKPVAIELNLCGNSDKEFILNKFGINPLTKKVFIACAEWCLAYDPQDLGNHLSFPDEWGSKLLAPQLAAYIQACKDTGIKDIFIVNTPALAMMARRKVAEELRSKR